MRYLVSFGVLSLIALFSGCLSSGGSVVYTLYGGERLVVPLSAKGIEPPKDDAIQVIMADFKPSKEKQRLEYIFIFKMLKDIPVKSVRVEDYSDETAPPVLLVEAKSPDMKEGIWGHKDAYLLATDPRIKWIYYEVPTPFIYRFTIELEDGSKHVLTHVVMFPVFMKPMLREVLGLSNKP